MTLDQYESESKTDPKTHADQILLIERYRAAGLMTEAEYQLKAADLDLHFGQNQFHSVRVA